MAADINFLSFIYFGLIIIPILFIMKNFRINLLRSTIFSIFQMIIQLFFVGFYLQYIFKYNNFFINILYLFFMILMATYTILKSISLKELKLCILIFISIFIPLILNLFLLNILAIKLSYVFDAKYLIPISGMILGNILNGLIITLNDFLDNFIKNENEYLLSISFGATKDEAMRPFIKRAINLSVKPSIASMSSIGIVALPGMMTGQILGGSLPMIAIKYQILIMLAIFNSKFFSTYILLELIKKNYFNKFLIFDKRMNIIK